MANAGWLDRIDPTFTADLRASETAVWRVARWLHACGQECGVAPVYVRPTAADRADYRDRGDLTVTHRIEVKHYQIVFTSVDDYPYPNVMFTRAELWDTARPKPWVYFVVNAAQTHVAVVHSKSEPWWVRVPRVNRHRNQAFVALECPIRFVRVCALSDAPAPGDRWP